MAVNRRLNLGSKGEAWVVADADALAREAASLVNSTLHVAVTTYGSPWWVVRLYAGNAGHKVLMRGMKPMCAKGVRSFYLAHYDMDHSTDRSRQAFLDKVRRTVGGVG